MNSLNHRTAKTTVSRSRIGKKTVIFYVEPPVHKKLRLMAVERDMTLQDLMLEAANLLLKSKDENDIKERLSLQESGTTPRL